MTTPAIRGWCPGAHKPMMSGDGLVVRVRPFRAELSAVQVLGLCDIASEFGNGMLDLTSRANLQIRGVATPDHPELLVRLDALGLIDPDPATESRRNILMPHSWDTGDLTDRLYRALEAELPHLPDLPDKMGFALDTGKSACLQNGSADFRFELDTQNQLLLRADGSATGQAIAEDNAMAALQDMAAWFRSTGGLENGRMARHVQYRDLPTDWTGTPPRPQTANPPIGPVANGTLLGAPFGRMKAEDLQNLIQVNGATHMRLTLNRLFFLNVNDVRQAKGFVTKPSPLMHVHACPGAPFCPQASVETMQVAETLAATVDKELHVSGCAKGCAHPHEAAVTLVGRDGQFDLVLDGRPWDDPSQRGIDPYELLRKADVI